MIWPASIELETIVRLASPGLLKFPNFFQGVQGATGVGVKVLVGVQVRVKGGVFVGVDVGGA